ncbi:MAG: GNAT family N-acetyltransferase [Spirochaetales bacterium]|nr:GNAT family N-acetyltransferase [Spirochaetales bacterium]
MLCLVRFEEISETQYEDYITEWELSGEDIIPSASKRRDRTFTQLQESWRMEETDAIFAYGFVPSTLFFLIDEQNKVCGAIHLRHELNERLKQNGGHIGYGIRPSERHKGYGTEMLSLLLEKIWVDGYERVLITCDDDNIASAKTIAKNGGILFDKPMFEGILTRRYWINKPLKNLYERTGHKGDVSE